MTTLSIEDRVRYIIANVKRLEQQDRIDIGKAFVRAGYGENIKYNADGAVINLAKLDGVATDLKFVDDTARATIMHVYALVHRRIEKQMAARPQI